MEDTGHLELTERSTPVITRAVSARLICAGGLSEKTRGMLAPVCDTQTPRRRIALRVMNTPKKTPSTERERKAGKIVIAGNATKREKS